MIVATINLSNRLQTVFLWITFIVPVAFNIHSSFHPELDIERAILGIALFVLWILIIGIYAWITVRQNQSSKNLILSVLSLAVWIWPTPLLLSWFPIGDYVHLAADYNKYKAKIAASPNSRLEFNWGGGGWAAGPSFDRMLVYDPMDNLLQENNLKDTELRKKYHHFSNGKEYFDQRLISRRLIGHFYIVEARYQ